MSRAELKRGDRLVVKIGSASLVGADGELDSERLDSLCAGLAGACLQGIETILVSSGAIAAGLAPLGLELRPSDMPGLQAAAAVGQGRLLARYSSALAGHGLVAAQMLLTRYDFMHRSHYLNARNTLDRLLALGALPVVNENDTVATDEIGFGDNDRLAALVANLARARLLVLLTDAKGLHLSDPRRYPSAPVIEEVDRITPELERRATAGGSGFGSGGMASKLSAAWVATFSGTAVVIADASEPQILDKILSGDRLGTYFRPRPRRLSARRLWIAFAQPPRGTVVVDPGAQAALTLHKRSLLPVGVSQVRGEFSSGDAVDVCDAEGRVFARGLVRYGAAELQKAAGRSTAGTPGAEVIHIDELVVLEE
jgi:glutamate 5-kinase